MKILTILCIMVCNVVWAQQETHFFKNNLFLELLGNGGYASINYERIVFSHNNLSLCPSIGISTFKTKDFNQNINPDIIIPIGVRCYYNIKSSKLLAGLGQTYSSQSKLDTETFEPKRTSHLSANFMLGYRYDFKRTMLQLAYTPILENYSKYKNWIGFAVGYKF